MTQGHALKKMQCPSFLYESTIIRSTSARFCLMEAPSEPVLKDTEEGFRISLRVVYKSFLFQGVLLLNTFEYKLLS